MFRRVVWGEIVLSALILVIGILYMFDTRVEIGYRILLLIALFYLFHLISPARLIFGTRNIMYDILFLSSFVLLSGKSAFPFLGNLTSGSTLAIGGFALFVTCLIAAERLPTIKPSIAAHFHTRSRLGRALLTFLLATGFFIMVFDPSVRLSLSLSSVPLLRPLLSALVLAWIIDEQGHLPLQFARTFGAALHRALREVLNLFFHRKTLLLGVAGLLTLHFAVQVGGALAPSLFIALLELQGVWEILAGSVSAIGTLCLYVLPLYIWFTTLRVRASHEHLPDWPGWLIGLVLACIVAATMFPITELGPSSVFGATLEPAVPDATPLLALAAASAVLLICLLVGRLDAYLRRVLMMGPFAAAVIFLGSYAYHAFVSAFLVAASDVLLYASGLLLFAVPIILVLFAMQVLFFIAGYLSFLYEIWRD